MPDTLHIPIVEEEARVVKRAAAVEQVSVRTSAAEEHVVVRDDVRREQVEVTRIPVDRAVAEAPAIRTEGDLTIIPVVEERLVVEKRLFVTEELYVRRTATTEPVEMPMTLRRTRVEIERTTIDQQENE